MDDVWPQFLHPYPLSATYHLVAAKPSPDALWGIYLVDVFDNMVLIEEVPGNALLWPIPMQQDTPKPPVIASRVNVEDSEGRMLVTDITQGGSHAGDRTQPYPAPHRRKCMRRSATATKRMQKPFVKRSGCWGWAILSACAARRIKNLNELATRSASRSGTR